MKNYIKKFIPRFFLSILKKILLFLKRLKIIIVFIKIYFSDMIRYLKYSRTFGNNNSFKLIGSIILQYHVIEKGLTMPETRFGFGGDRIISLCKACIEYKKKYGEDDDQLNHAVGVVLEYEEFHNSRDFKLQEDVIFAISQLKLCFGKKIRKTTQTEMVDKEYFRSINSSFFEFSKSRSSIRNFSSKELPLTNILDAIELSRNTPSACNRQSWRTYIYTSKDRIKEILDAQGGNRGFGHLVNKLIVISGEQGVYSYTNERFQVYIDGGIYAMNLLYALHYKAIAACILNCSFDYSKEQKIKKMAVIKDSEVLIAMIACGHASEVIKIANSPKYKKEKTTTIIN